MSWRQALAAASHGLEPGDFETYVSLLQPVSQRNGTLALEAPSRLAVEVIERRYRSTLEEALAQVSGGAMTRIQLLVRSLTQQELFPGAPRKVAPVPAASIRRALLLPKYTFDS